MNNVSCSYSAATLAGPLGWIDGTETGSAAHAMNLRICERGKEGTKWNGNCKRHSPRSQKMGEGRWVESGIQFPVMLRRAGGTSEMGNGVNSSVGFEAPTSCRCAVHMMANK